MSTAASEVWVKHTDMTALKTVDTTLPALKDGEIMVRIDTFALTANNVSYGLSGDLIGYWKFFPTFEEGWGKVPVWGMADVVESACPDIKVGERIYGFFPMSSHLVLTPGRIRDLNFMDLAPHRTPLPALYNQYMRTEHEPDFIKGLENERCLYFPLFITGYVIADLLADNDWFGAKQVIVASASSKTGIGTAAFLKAMGYEGKVVGLTSPANAEFVGNLGHCDEVVLYNDAANVDQVPTVYVDMSGDAGVRAALHNRLGDHMVSNQMVGLTHWDQGAHDKSGLPGAKPVFFFAPAQIEKRNADWGPGVLMERGYGASAKLAAELAGQVTVEHLEGATALQEIWQAMLANTVSGKRGIMVRL